MWSADAYQRALVFAAHAHGPQKMPGGDLPYVTHVALVAGEVICTLAHEPGHDEDLAVQCALLHDTLEDTPTRHCDLEQTFGRAVADGVAALTKDGSLPKADKMADSLARIARAPVEIAIVKLCDRIVNLRPPPADWSPEKRAAYREEARAIHRALAHASPHAAARLLEKIAAYDP
jgi:(p)ppGpp synthase/HD superfamily hydrolase